MSFICRAGLIALMVVGSVAARAEAEIVRFVVTSVERPTFEGMSFGSVGQYEKLRGRAFGEVDPNDPRNAIITDIEFAPRNARGMVEYSMDVLILKPIDLSRGNGQLLYHMNNRGNLQFLFSLNNGGLGNNPTTAADAGNGFLMRYGYTIVSSGWDAGVAPSASLPLTITVPVAKNPDGSAIVGPSLEEFVVDTAAMMTGPLTYAAANTDQGQATLTVREHYTDPSVTIPSTGWAYISAAGTAIRLLPVGTAFQQGRLYEFTYPAKDPIVAGLGFAATRDLGAFLRDAVSDDDGNPNPLAGSVRAVYTHCLSLPCRMMRDFVHLGFNESEPGHRVIDGVLNWGAGASSAFVNFRFAQPGRGPSQRISRWYPVRQFPFANQTLTDTVTGETGGRLERCTATGTCPKIFEINSANDYWTKVASALTTDTVGNDLRDAPAYGGQRARQLRLSAESACSKRHPPGDAHRARQVGYERQAAPGKRRAACGQRYRGAVTVTSRPRLPECPGRAL